MSGEAGPSRGIGAAPRSPRRPYDRRRHARLRLHGQGAHERLQDARVHDMAAAAATRGSSRSPDETRSAVQRPRAPLRLRAVGRPTGARWSTTTDVAAVRQQSARTTCTPSRRSPRPRPASTWSARSRSAAPPRRLRDLAARWQATGVKHLCAFNYRFVPAVRLARQMIEAGELGEIHHFRGRYLQEWVRRPDHSTTWRFDSDAGRVRRARRPRRARDRPGALPRRRDRAGRGGCAHVHRERAAAVDVDDAFEAAVDFDARRRRHDRGDALRARPQERAAAGRSTARRGSLAFDLERLNELQIYRASGDAASPRVLVTEADDPFWSWWWPHGHMIGWEHTLRPRAPPPAHRDRRRQRRRAPRRRPSRTATAPPRYATRSSAQVSQGSARPSRRGCRRGQVPERRAASHLDVDGQIHPDDRGWRRRWERACCRPIWFGWRDEGGGQPTARGTNSGRFARRRA